MIESERWAAYTGLVSSELRIPSPALTEIVAHATNNTIRCSGNQIDAHGQTTTVRVGFGKMAMNVRNIPNNGFFSAARPVLALAYLLVRKEMMLPLAIMEMSHD